MDVSNELRPAQAEEVIVALELPGVVPEAFCPEVFLGELMRLDHGAHGAIKHEDALSERSAKLFFYIRIFPRGAHRDGLSGLD